MIIIAENLYHDKPRGPEGLPLSNWMRFVLIDSEGRIFDGAETRGEAEEKLARLQGGKGG